MTDPLRDRVRGLVQHLLAGLDWRFDHWAWRQFARAWLSGSLSSHIDMFTGKPATLKGWVADSKGTPWARALMEAQVYPIARALEHAAVAVQRLESGAPPSEVEYFVRLAEATWKP